MDIPKKIKALEALIKNEVQENIHLDYKDSRAVNRSKRHEIAKDVSAFANSDGGLLIYGITEENHLPISIDDGVDHNKYSREWIEEVITSNVSPKIDGITIIQIPLSKERSSFVIEIPKSYRAPHQEQNQKRYYKRYNFKSQPMEDYEINDIRNRSLTVNPLVNFDIKIKHSVMIYFEISNIGKVPAKDVRFSFSIESPWRNENRKPPIFSKGIKYLPPGRAFRIFFHTAQEIFSDDKKIPTEFDVSATYFHPEINQEITDEFHIDFNDFLHTDAAETELYQHGEKIGKSINSLVSEIKTLNRHMDHLSNISGPTGLDLSITSLRGLNGINNGNLIFPKIDPRYCDRTAFSEILQIDNKLSSKIERHFVHGNSFDSLHEIDGVTDEIMSELQKYFLIEGNR